jgi:small conductance mechanosensitive channel
MDISSLLPKIGTIPARLVQITLVIVLGLIVLRIIRVVVKRLEKRVSGSKVDPQQQARLKTLLSAGNYIVTILVIFIDALMVLMVLGINITPVLASVGVAGLALSLGAQSLIKDYIGGVVILIEDQFRVGDAVTILENTGVVEEVGLRATRLRDLEGRLIIISNGDIRIISRAGYDWARAVVDLNVTYNADIGMLVKVLDGAMQRANEDPEISDYLLEAPVVQGWSGFTAWSVQVRLTAKTLPDKKLEVAARLRKVAQEALREAGLQMATPLPDAQPGGSI